MSEILIKNGNIVTSNNVYKSDILIKDSKIELIDINIKTNSPNVKIIDAQSMYVLPGAIDPHVHMELPTPAGNSSDDFRTGSIAALAGGTTSIIDFVTPSKGQSFIEALNLRKKEAEKSLIDYGFHMSPTWWGKNSANEMKKCVIEEGITSFKTYLAYKKVVGISDEILINVMKTAKDLNALVTLHCENGDIVDFLKNKFISEGKTQTKYHVLSRPPEVESEAVNRATTFAKLVGCPIYIVHVSTKQSIDIIKKAQESGQKVYAETCPHYLLLDKNIFNKNDFSQTAPYVLSPALRTKEHRNKLWNALSNNIINTVASDHCPFNVIGQKDVGINDFTKIPNGAGGVEHRLSLLYTYGVSANLITINQFVDLIATNPAKIFGLSHRKGKIAKGMDADIVIWNPDKEEIISAKTHKQNCDSNIFENYKVKGMPEIVIANGKIALENDTVNVNDLKGNYLFRKVQK
ncbi:MAG: dihydropyrimidinase [Bacteroidetes bacterium]|nr:dihydropyrimidinase [Bacteroidota bacterium]